MRPAAVQYLSRPFVVGDSIEIRTGSGAKVVSGFVDSITPMRTNLRTGAATTLSWMLYLSP